MAANLKNRWRAVFISPHLDDAVFSAGGTIARLLREGPVLVINVFTHYDTDVRHYGVVFGRERCEEETRAAEFLGYTGVNLDEPDAFFRRTEYRAISRLFAPPVAADLADLPRLAARIAGVLDGISFETLYAPLGIGWHVDHVLCHRAACGRARDVRYYEDAPYCFLPNAVRYRVDELAGRTGRGPSLREWRDTSRGFRDTAMIRNIRPRLKQMAAGAVSSLYLLKLMRAHRRNGAGRDAAGALRLGAHLEDISGFYARKAAAMRLYRSQFGEFFTGPEQCDALHREHAVRCEASGAACERFWRTGSDSAGAREDAA